MQRLAFSSRAVCLSTLIFLACAGPASADLVGFWSFDDESADDLSGNGNDGIVNGLEFSDDTPNGGGASLDVFGGGTVQVPHSESLGMADTMTVAFWMKAVNEDQPSDWNGPMGKISDPRESGGWEMQRWENSSRIDIRIDTNEGANSVRGNLIETFDDEWVHVAWTVDEGEWASFLDGELIEAGGYPHGDGFANESDLFFGNRANCCNYVGLLDEIGIWDDVLSDEEIEALAAGESPVGPPVGPTGDFNADGKLDVADVNLLIGSINGAMENKFDVNNDGAVNDLDLTVWVKDLKKTWIGDADLDGEFNSGDLVGVFQSGKFESGQAATWDGDWTGDQVFGSSDFVAAFQDGGFEQGAVPAQSVPEPDAFVLAMLAIVGLIGPSRFRRLAGR